MNLEIWLLYAATVAALMSTPGPSHLLMLSNSLAHGFPRSGATAIGDLTANLLQMLLAGFGLAALLVTFENALFYIKWAGVLYLAFIGLQTILAKRKPAKDGASKKASLKRLWLQGFITSASNPKAVIFFAALFPQFISASEPFWPQFIILSATYLAMDGFMLTLYGAGASWVAKRVSHEMQHRLKKLGGVFMIGAAILLGLKPVEAKAG